MAKKNKKPILDVQFNLPFTRSYVVIKGNLQNKERLFHALTKEKIVVYKPTIKEKFLYFAVNVKDMEKTFAICEKLCYTILIWWDIGLKNLFSNILCKVGIVVGLLLGIIAVMVSNLYVWKIEITGNQKLDDVVIQRFLKENNIRVGTKKNFSTTNLTIKLNELDGVEDSVIRIVGTTLKIDIVESTSFIPPDTQVKTEVLSDFDGVVTQIIVNSGTAAVKIGDIVKKGDVLIKGEFTNQAGDVVSIPAKGKVYGTVAYSAHKVVSTQCVKKTYGKVNTKNTLSIFGIKIGRAKVPNGYECKANTKKFFLLPIKVTTYTYRKVNFVTQQTSIDKLKDDFIKETQLKFGFLDGQIETNVIMMAQNIYRINVYITVQTLLSK